MNQDFCEHQRCVRWGKIWGGNLEYQPESRMRGFWVQVPSLSLGRFLDFSEFSFPFGKVERILLIHLLKGCL